MREWDYASWVSKLKEAPAETNEVWVSSGVFIVPVRCAEVI